MKIAFREVLVFGLISLVSVFVVGVMLKAGQEVLLTTIGAIVTITSLANVMIVVQQRNGGK